MKDKIHGAFGDHPAGCEKGGRFAPDTSQTAGSRTQDDKHLPFFKLIDACREGGCPVCATLRGDEAGYFDSLLYEKVNNRHFRAKFNLGGGFCGYHAKYLEGLHDALAVVLLYRQILRYELDGEPLQTGKSCPACDYLQEKERQVKSVLWQYINDPEFIDAFQQTDGLCLPHYRQFKSEHLKLPGWFTEYNRQQYEQLFKDSNDYVDACNFTLGGSRSDPEIHEARVYQQLIERLYGFIGLSPHVTARGNKRGAGRTISRRGGTRSAGRLLRGLFGRRGVKGSGPGCLLRRLFGRRLGPPADNEAAGGGRGDQGSLHDPEETS